MISPASDVQKWGIPRAILHPLDDWMQACGYATDHAAAMVLHVDRKTIPRWRTRELSKVERLAMAALYHRIPPFERPLVEWMRDCGFATDVAAATALEVDRHTVANWRGRALTKLERLALAAVFHRVAAFDRRPVG